MTRVTFLEKLAISEEIINLSLRGIKLSIQSGVPIDKYVKNIEEEVEIIKASNDKLINS